MNDNFLTRSWRPFVGYTQCFMALGVYFVLPLLHITPPQVPTEVWLMFASTSGVASYFRGRKQLNDKV